MEAGDAAEAKFRVGEFTEVIGGYSEEDLVAESFVSFLIGAEGGLVVVEDAVDFANLGGGGAWWVHRVDRTINGREEREAARDNEINGWG